MPTGKTSTLTFRIKPSLKDALRTAAEREHRSIANMVEVMIRDYCRLNEIAIPEELGSLPAKIGKLKRQSGKNR